MPLGGMHGTLDVFKLDGRNYLNLSCTVDLLSADWQPMVRGLSDAAEPLSTFSLHSISLSTHTAVRGSVRRRRL